VQRTYQERKLGDLDARIVCDAAHYAATLVTGDRGSKTQPGGILGNRHKLPDIKILSPEQAVAFIRQQIRERQEFNVHVVSEIGGEPPEWTGKD
jgi:hypothetical protein